MTDNFTQEFFSTNRRSLANRLATEHGDVPIVVTANGALQRNGDALFAFRQDSSFWYLTGIDEPDITLVIDGGNEFLIVPVRDAVRTAFDGAIDYQALMTRSGVPVVLDEIEGWQRLRRTVSKSANRVATLLPPPSYIDHAGFYTNPSRERLRGRLTEAGVDQSGLVDVREILSDMRAVKQPAELEAMRKAIEITIDSLQSVTSDELLKGCRYEFQAEAELTREFKLKGASGHAFEPIIVAGKRACTLHNVAMDGEISQSELLQFDVGAEYSQYAADISRVYAIGEPTERQRAVHAAVVEAQDYALGLLKPGVLLAEYEEQVTRFIGKKLVGLGVIASDRDDDVRKYYPHAASHYLGLDVHDAGPYTKPLQAGMVVTCEPGIYIAEESIGIRIEDDVLITDDGCEVLSSRLSRGLR